MNCTNRKYSDEKEGRLMVEWSKMAMNPHFILVGGKQWKILFWAPRIYFLPRYFKPPPLSKDKGEKVRLL